MTPLGKYQQSFTCLFALARLLQVPLKIVLPSQYHPTPLTLDARVREPFLLGVRRVRNPGMLIQVLVGG